MWIHEKNSIEEFWGKCKEHGERYIKELDKLMAKTRKKQTLVPVFRWAQSNSEVFIEVKLSHRFDSPGCLDKIEETEFDKILSVENRKILNFWFCLI